MIRRKSQMGSAKPRQTSGFTLMEVVISIGLLAMIIGMVMPVAVMSTRVSRNVVDVQNQNMGRAAFYEMMRRHFEQLPGNAVLELQPRETRNRKEFDLTFQNAPISFQWGGSLVTAEAVRFSVRERRDGFVNLVMEFYEEPILDDGVVQGDESVEPMAEIVLLEELWLCECEAVDARSMEAEDTWDLRGRLPRQVKFFFRFSKSGEIVEYTFWITPKQNPVTVMRQINQQNPAGPQDGGLPAQQPGGRIPPVNVNPVIPQAPRGGGR